MKSNFAKISMTSSLVLAAGILGYQVKKTPDHRTLVEKIQAGEKQYIVYNKFDFLKSTTGSRALSLGGTEMKIINGVVLNKKPDIDLGSDWVVQEEQVYHTQQLKGCEYSPPPAPPDCEPPDPIPTPTPPPCTGGNCPDPNPSPAPTPPPPASNEFLWWAKQVGADLAQSKVNTSDQVVCVLDTGIDMNHPELSGQIAGGSNMIGGTSYQDDQGHGTHVAGIISAKLGNGGLAGVSQAKVYMVKVLDRQGSGLSSWIANGIVDCVNKGHLLLSMSLGSDSPDSIIKQAVDYAASRGAIIIAAAGNNGGAVGYPAGYPNVVAVSAVDQAGKLASFSSRGTQIDYAGYGVNILSLKLGGGTVSYSGTSMATPGVAAVFAFAKKLGKPVAAVNLNLQPTQQGSGLAHAGETTK